MDNRRAMKVAMIVSGGGHLDEALCLIDAFKDAEIIIISYHQKSLLEFKHPRIKKLILFPLFASRGPLLYLSLLLGIFKNIVIFLREKPDILFSTGSEIAVFPFYLGKYLFQTRNIFIETVTRFSEPSQTAKWVYQASDVFLVQWPELLRFFGPKTKYVGNIL